MNRQQLIENLANYQCFDSKEEADRSTMLTFVNKYPRCFHRDLEIGHMTASTWLLNAKRDKALLMHHRKLDLWLQLGGHCDGDEDLLAVAVKEAQEESGIWAIKPLSDKIFDIDIHDIPANSKEPAHKHYDVRFLLGLTEELPFVQNSESLALAWVTADSNSLPKIDRSVQRLHQKWLSKWVENYL